MAHAIFIDTFQIAKNMKEAKYTEIQIEERIKHDTYLVTEINKVISDDLATKKDVAHAIKSIEDRFTLSDKNTNKWGWLLMFNVTIVGILIYFHH